MSRDGFAALLLVATAIAVMGCRTAERGRTAPRGAETTRRLSPGDSSARLQGVWTVVGHRVPGVSAMSGADAAAWHGRTVRLTRSGVRSGETACDRPAFATRTAPADSLLRADYHLTPALLGLPAELQRVTLVEVSCGGTPWTVLGGRMIGFDRDHAFAPWDGVFFELARNREFRALGQEPGWQLTLQPGRETRFSYEYGEREVAFPTPEPDAVSGTGRHGYHVKTVAHELGVAIDPVRCTDAMSGNPFATTVTVVLDGETYRGCGGPYP